MLKQTIDVNLSQIDKIYHIADVHIRNLKRHQEYRQVFRRLYKEIRKDTKNALIYVAGDIVHAKTDMSPELISMTAEFFKNLAKLAPTIVIMGNHDTNLNNTNRLDAISPIIDSIETENLFYLREAGVYSIANIDFAVFSRLNTIEQWPTAKDCTQKTKIALYHGTVQQTITDSGIRLTHDSVKLEMFRGFTFGLLGDIHKHQFLNKQKTIAYPGSLIQQNHGEDYENHGMLKWDVANRTYEYIKIHNDYGYYTLRIKKGVPEFTAELPKNPRLRIKAFDTEPSKVQEIIRDIRKKCNIQDIVVLNQQNLMLDGTDNTSMNIIGDIFDAGYQNQLIREYIQKYFHDVDDDTMQDVIDINTQANQKVSLAEINRGVTWDIKRVKFSNMFSYGENNEIDFENMKGVYGLFSPNATGKSAIADVILFCLFDKCSRATKAINILNNRKNRLYCKLHFTMNDVDYFIERKGTRVTHKNGTSNISITTNFWKEDKDGKKTSLNGKQRSETNTEIQKLVGSYENFVMTAIALQNNLSSGFIGKTQAERKNLFASFVSIDFFDRLHEVARIENKDIVALLKDFKKQNWGEKLAQAELAIDRYQDKYDKIDAVCTELKDKKTKINDEILDKTSQIINIGDRYDIEELETHKEQIEGDLTKMQQGINMYSASIAQITSESMGILEKYQYYDYDKMMEKKDELDKHQTEFNEIKNDLNVLKVDLEHKQGKLNKLENFKYDESCSFCMDNPFVKDAIETKESIETETEKFRALLGKGKDIGEVVKSLQSVEDELSTYHDMKRRITELKGKYDKTLSYGEKLDSKVETLNTDLAYTDEKITIYHRNEETIKNNQSLQDEIDVLKTEWTKLDYEQTNYNEEKQTIHSQIKLSEKTRDDIQGTLDRIANLERKHRAYGVYLGSVNRDGLPYELITKIVPIFEAQANDILSQIVDFKIMLHLDNKNIDGYIVYDDDRMWTIEMTSGMERFICSMALRVALNKIATIPKPSFLFIDEGFGNLDAGNINNMNTLFNMLKNHYDFVNVVSHLDGMRDMVENFLEIKNNGKFSNITYL